MNTIRALLHKTYDERNVLDLEISFQSGTLYGILGPNGSGKTTLLRMLSRVEDPNGSSYIQYLDGDTMIHPDQELLRKTVLAPDRSGLFNDTVHNNVRFGLSIRNKTNDEIEEAVENSLHSVNLTNLKNENAHHLSNGEAQRLCLAMAMAVNPQVILLDEPTASLDPENAAMVEDIILAMKSEDRIIILVTHNIFQAKRLADHVSFLYNGKMLENAAAKEFFETPETPEAQRFLSGSLVY